ncbi:MAG: hypothetical protein SFZ03_00480 [Candidatus Melainabacteria bacterium]|nr:hypothetical protein [Candidatus Melainabacteria bacterium]
MNDLWLTTAGACMILSRGWRLFRQQMLPCLLLLLIPNVLYSVMLLLLAPGFQERFTRSLPQAVVLGLLLLWVYVLLAVVVLWPFFLLLCAGLFARRSYRQLGLLADDAPHSWQADCQAMLKKAPGLFVYYLLALGLAGGLFLLDGLLYVLVFFALSWFATSALALVDFPLSLLFAALIYAGFHLVGLALLGLQMTGLICPVVAAAVEDRQPMASMLWQAMAGVVMQPRRSLLFGGLGIAAGLCFMAAWWGPMLLYLFTAQNMLDSTRYDLPAFGLDWLTLTLLSLWGQVGSTVLGGFWLTSLVWFHIDCQNRREGLDLWRQLQTTAGPERSQAAHVPLT